MYITHKYIILITFKYKNKIVFRGVTLEMIPYKSNKDMTNKLKNIKSITF